MTIIFFKATTKRDLNMSSTQFCCLYMLLSVRVGHLRTSILPLGRTIPCFVQREDILLGKGRFPFFLEKGLLCFL